MAEKRAQRRLAAILVADVAGYSRLMEADEAATLDALRMRRRTVLEPVIAAHGGRIVKLMGDGVLVEFASAVEAVEAAIELQRKMTAANDGVAPDRHIHIRIGVNLGEIVIEGADIFGDGVNLAARLESLAAPGGICVSAKVHDEVRGKIDAGFEDVGEHKLKNIGVPVRAYRISPNIVAKAARPSLAIPDRPSIAVLPFTNMSSDPEQDSFADGMTEDLITDLSRVGGLFVIARNSTFAYKGKAVDVRAIARDLGVRYLLEGSARRSAARVRINVQLIDALGGDHVWAERFDRNVEDIFTVQDEVTAKIVEALIGRLTRPPPRYRPRNLEAYDLCVRARTINEDSPSATREARVMLERAIALDPDYAEAHRWLAVNIWIGWTHFGDPKEPNRHIALATAEKAVALDPNDAGNHWALATILNYEKRWAEADGQFSRALELDPNNADTWADRSDSTVLAGRTAEGLEQIEKALRLNPRPDSWYYLLHGQALYAARDYEGAIKTLRREETYRTHSRRFLAASLAQLGRIEEARHEGKLFMTLNPYFTIGHWLATQPLRDQATGEHFADGFRKAGLPD